MQFYHAYLTPFDNHYPVLRLFQFPKQNLYVPKQVHRTYLFRYNNIQNSSDASSVHLLENEAKLASLSG